jgi:hypothetical protein
MSIRKDLLRNKGRLWVFDELAANKVWREVGIVDSCKFSMMSNPGDAKTPSGVTIMNWIDPDAEITCDWYHPGDLSIIECLFRGALSLTSSAGSTDITESVLVEFNNASDAFPLPGADGDKTVVTVSAVVLASATSTTYTVTTDYTIAVDPVTGVTHIVQVSGGSIPLKTPILVTYTWRPLAGKIIKPVDNGEQIFRTIILDVFTNPSDATKYIRYVLPRCTVTSDLVQQHIEFGKDNSSPNIMPLAFKYAKPDTNTNDAKWYILNTHNV